MLIKMGKERPRSRATSPTVIVKNYEHYNKAFRNWDSPHGRYISSKADYHRALAEEGMITEKEADRMGLNTEAKRQAYDLTYDTQQLIESVKQTKDSKGNIRPSDRAIEALAEKKKAVFNYNQSLCPEHYRDKSSDLSEGGFRSDPVDDNKGVVA